MPVFADDLEAPTFVGQDEPTPFDHLIRTETRDTFASLIRDSQLDIPDGAKIYRSEGGAFVEAYVFAETTTVPFNLDDETIDVEVNRDLSAAVKEALSEFEGLAPVASVEPKDGWESIEVMLTDGTAIRLKSQILPCGESRCTQVFTSTDERDHHETSSECIGYGPAA
jgi:hypothetical protein